MGSSPTGRKSDKLRLPEFIPPQAGEQKAAGSIPVWRIQIIGFSAEGGSASGGKSHRAQLFSASFSIRQAPIKAIFDLT